MKNSNGAEFTLNDILSVEDDPSILDFKCEQTGVLLWPIVRVPFLRAILSDFLYETPIAEGMAAIPKSRALNSLGKALMHNGLHSKQRADIFIMATGVGNQLIGDKFFNRLSDHFAALYPDRTVVMEDFFDWKWPFPRHNERVLFHAPIQISGVLSGRFLCRDVHRQRARQLISLVAGRAHKLLNWDLGAERSDRLVSSLARKSAAIPWLYRRYQRLLQGVQPKILIKEEACYGPSAVLIHAAKAMGIVTAEYQHGVISSGHDAYNFAATLRNSSDYRQTLPDYFLSYGKWWGDQINAPVKNISIGNPYRTEKLSNLPLLAQSDGKDLLILGDGIETPRYIELARELRHKLDSRFNVVFRPHPLERESVLLKYPEGRIENVVIDQNVDIYHSFTNSFAVVSELSTGLFEAIGLVQNIFVWDTYKARFCFPEHPFSRFASVEDLVERISNMNQHDGSSDDQGIWQAEWKKHYQDFIGHLGLDRIGNTE
jgi:hypothetical protein